MATSQCSAWHAFCGAQVLPIYKYYSKKIQKYLVPIRRILFYNPWISAIFFMFLFAMIAFLPLLYHRDDYNGSFLANHHEYQVFFNQTYKQWLLITLLVAIPMVINLLLDAHWCFHNVIDFNHWLARLVFVCALCMPNACLLILTEGDYDSANPYIPQLQLSLFLSQQVIIIGSFFGTLFGQKMISVSNPNDQMQISVEERTVYFLITLVIGKLLLFFASLKHEIPSSSVVDGLFILGLLIVGFGVLQVLLLSFHVLAFLGRQSRHFEFQSHIHMSAFYNVLAVAIFVVCDFVLFSQSNRFLDIDPRQANETSYQFVVEFLYLQIGLTYFLSIIPGRAYMLSAQLKQDKLNIRLNLIRYVSHEMRTPLNTAFLGLGMLMTAFDQVENRLNESTQNAAVSKVDVRPVLTESQLEDMVDTTKQVHDSCHIALETLNDLLTFDKLDENKLVVEVNETDPWQLVCEAARPFEINAREKNVNFSINCVDEDSNWTLMNYVRADQFKISQVIRNLISNALKFTPEQGTVKVIVERLMPSNNTSLVTTTMAPTLVSHAPQVLRITVQDTGAGISIENQKKLFGQYVQFNAAALQQGKGSGLGLWIAKSIIEMHGGKIAGSSEGEGLGSTFTIELPLFTKDYTARSRTDYNSTSPERLNESPSGNFSMSKIGLTVRAALGLQQGANRRSKEMSEPSLLNHRVVLQDMSEYGGSQSNRISGNASTRMLARTASGRSTDNKSWRSTGSKPPAPRSNLSSPDTQHRKQWREGSRQAESPINPNTRSIAQTLKGLIKGDQNVQTKASGHSNRIVQTSESNSLLKGPSLSDLLVPNPTNVENSFHDLLNQDSMKSSGSRIEHDLVGENIHAIPKPIGLDKTLTGFDLSMASLASMDTSPDRYEDSLSRITPKTNQIYPVTGSFLERCEVQNQRTIESTIKHAEDKPPEPVLSEHANDDSLKEDHNMTLDKTAKSDKSWETGLTILIVDDSAPNRKMLRKLLTNGGHKVYDCYDGVDCLEKLDYLDEHSFGLKSSLPDIDVILMDEHMPRMNGPEATKILVDRGFAGVIYAVTGTVGNEDASNVFLKSGAEAVFCKPLNMELLKQQVNRYFQKLRLQKTIHEKNQKAPPKS